MKLGMGWGLGLNRVDEEEAVLKSWEVGREKVLSFSVFSLDELRSSSNFFPKSWAAVTFIVVAVDKSKKIDHYEN